MEMLLEKTPPYSEEAEQAVLGSMLLDREAIIKATENLKEEDFYRPSHRTIFRMMVDLFNRGEPVDLVTLTGELRSANRLDEVGGIPYITKLADIVPTSANVGYYAKIVAEKSLLRELINTTTEVVTRAYEGGEEVDSLLDYAEKEILRIAQRQLKGGFTSLQSLMVDAIDQIENLSKSKGKISGVPTGYDDLNAITLGFQPSDLIIVAARPSMGKTSFCLNIAQNAALQYGIPVAIFSLEMSKEQLALRMLCSEARVSSQKLRSGDVDEDDWLRLANAAGKLAEGKIYIDDTPGATVAEMRAKTRRMKAEHGLGMVVIDYLQLMQGNSRSDNRQQEISEISRGLKALARELNVPVVALSQLSRAVESRSTHRPQLSDLRESGALEQDADIVAFIYRDDYYNEDSEEPNIAEIIIAKHRNGPIGTVKLFFQKDFTRFENLEKFRVEG
jgi:replicative DNA helicase